VAGTFKQTSPNVFETDITASTTQTQGNGQLTANLNEVSTVANVDDVVTLPVAEEGRVVHVINNGANRLQIFPTSGADIQAAGVNISYFLEDNESVSFMGFSDLEWHIIAATEVLHAEAHDEDNVDAFVINAADEDHLYHTNGLSVGSLLGWNFDTGGAGTSFPIASIADASGGDITVTTTGAHGLAVGDIVSQTNLSDAAYVGVFKILTVPTTTTYTVTAVFTATGTGTMDQGFSLQCQAGAEGRYHVHFMSSVMPASANQRVTFGLYHEATKVVGSSCTRLFAPATDFGCQGGVAIVTVAALDRITVRLQNETSSANLTKKFFTIVLHRL